jgi:hypothetical protein
MYQNDGTDRVSPSRFVERAATAAGDWRSAINPAITAFLKGDTQALKRAGDVMAKDISTMCDRIRTGQLKASFRAVIINES